ncbi:MAG: response regulator [Betaproteobacteria bacterium]|nr:MAG: response regulator [Betaproteobacteria bacterium]
MTNELILIVEDDAESRMLERDILTYSGYRVLEAETAEAGLKLAREARPALILMDIRLPGMDGIAALRELRAEPATCDVPVIAVTASTMSQHRSQIVAAGFSGYHSKPIDIVELVASIRDVLARVPGATTP